MIGLKTKYVDCRITLKLYSISLNWYYLSSVILFSPMDANKVFTILIILLLMIISCGNASIDHRKTAGVLKPLKSGDNGKRFQHSAFKYQAYGNKRHVSDETVYDLCFVTIEANKLFTIIILLLIILVCRTALIYNWKYFYK